MKLLTEIINLLTDNSNPITTSLLKIKVLASRLNNRPLFDWVSKELSGYDTHDDVPGYRTYRCNLIGSYLNGNFKATNQMLPTEILPESIREDYSNISFYEGVSVLESYLLDKELTSIKRSVPASLIEYITLRYRGEGNRFFSLYSAYTQIGKGAVEQTLSEVRNSVLDLVLKLEEEYGFEIDMNELIQKKGAVNQTIYNYMNQTIHTSGNGNVITTGNDNSITNSVNIHKNNFQDLKKVLQENHVQETDIAELEEIITEQPDYNKKLFGPKVNGWMQKMMNKSLDGTWQVGIGTAGTLLAEAIKLYYGF